MGGTVGKIIGGVFGVANADKELGRIRDEKAQAKYDLEDARSKRQEIINPYAGITDLSGLAQDLSSQITNPFNNVTVATAAAEMQAEEADIALANTLDTLEQTGASAGGATALAMAALKSKKDVAATLQTQEAENSKLKAQGEQNMQREKVAAKQRAQEAQIQLIGRKEEADAKGEIFMFQAQERREMQQLNRESSLQSSASQQAAAYGAQQSQMLGQAVGALGTFAMQGGFGADGPFASKNNNTTTNPFAELNSRFDPAAQATIQQQQMGSNFMGSLGMNYNPYASSTNIFPIIR